MDDYDSINEKIEYKENSCLNCHKLGKKVPYDTVLSLCNSFIRTTMIYEQYYLCTNKNCDVIYYSKNKKILKNEIRVSVWYKENSLKMLICYCRKITLEDIVNIIKDIPDEVTVEKVVRMLEKEHIPKKCLNEMPTGKDCYPLFLNAIEYAKKILTLNSKL